jgi:O-Antigen ligase
MQELTASRPLRVHAARAGLGSRVVVMTLTATGAVASVMDAAFVDTFGPSRLFLVLVALLAAQALLQRRLLFAREMALYTVFVGYLLLATIWTPDRELALNTLFPALNFLALLLLYGSLMAYGGLRTALAGTVAGLVAGAAVYAYKVRFPLVRPPDFSYNAMAAVYLCGLFCALAYGWAKRAKIVPLSVGLIFWLHVVATTSIKTNLGVVLGTAVAAALYLRHSLRLLKGSLIVLGALGALITYALISDPVVTDHVTAGIDRVSIGLQVLHSREDVSGYSGFGEREYWMERGLAEWRRNPLFGHGVEAFRHDYGITSHSTPVDLLYNTGVIGFGLFYAMFASIALRLLMAGRLWPRAPLMLILSLLICNAFVTLSGTVFYQSFIAIEIAISVAILRHLKRAAEQKRGPQRE